MTVKEAKQKLKECIQEIRDKGIEVCRYDEKHYLLGDIISIKNKSYEKALKFYEKRKPKYKDMLMPSYLQKKDYTDTCYMCSETFKEDACASCIMLKKHLLIF